MTGQLGIGQFGERDHICKQPSEVGANVFRAFCSAALDLVGADDVALGDRAFELLPAALLWVGVRPRLPDSETDSLGGWESDAMRLVVQRLSTCWV